MWVHRESLEHPPSTSSLLQVVETQADRDTCLPRSLHGPGWDVPYLAGSQLGILEWDPENQNTKQQVSSTTGNTLVPEKAAAFDTLLRVSRRPLATTMYYDWNSSWNKMFASVLSHKKWKDPNQQQQYCSHFPDITQWGCGRYEFISLFRVMRFESAPRTMQ